MLVQLDNVKKIYGGSAGRPGVEVLRGVSLEVAAGDSVSIVGPSGSGKSTLMNMVGALDRPSSGEVRFDGRNLAGLSDAGLAAVRRGEIGFVFQFHHLLPQCTLMENVLVPALGGGGSIPAATYRRAEELLARVGLSERGQHRPGELSGGELQRAAVVRALVNGPRLLLADEPTGSLDRAAATGLGQLLVDINAEHGVALIVVTHSEELAGRMVRQYALVDGVLAKG